MESFNFNKKVETNLTSPENEAFMTKLAERARGLLSMEGHVGFSGRLLRASTLAATMALAACSSEDTEKQNSDKASAYSQAETSVSEKDYLEARMQKVRDEIHENQLKTEGAVTEAKRIASELGIDVSYGMRYTQEGFVITEINGVKIPDDFHKPAEQEQIKQARQIRENLKNSDTGEDANWSKSDSSFIDPNEF